MRVLVVTVVHHPLDARIFYRQVQALLAAGHQVTYAAPFSATDTDVPMGIPGLDLPRASGRSRLASLRRARRLIRREAPAHDVVLLHDPELLIAVKGLGHPCVVWDVHEDTSAAVSMKPWLPKVLRRPVAAGFRLFERAAEGRVHLLLAEEGYSPRFRSTHPVVPNCTRVPDDVVAPGTETVVYVGALTLARGAADLIEVGRRLGLAGPRVHLVGPADAAASTLLTKAVAEGLVEWHGFLPNDEALAFVDGALAGLSLLHDEPNYRHSRPTKVMEYMAHGVPVISTPTPPARDLVESADCGIVVPFGDAKAATEAVRTMLADPALRFRLAANGRVAALRDHDWRVAGPEFVRVLEEWSGSTA